MFLLLPRIDQSYTSSDQGLGLFALYGESGHTDHHERSASITILDDGTVRTLGDVGKRYTLSSIRNLVELVQQVKDANVAMDVSKM